MLLDLKTTFPLLSCTCGSRGSYSPNLPTILFLWSTQRPQPLSRDALELLACRLSFPVSSQSTEHSFYSFCPLFSAAIRKRVAAESGAGLRCMGVIISHWRLCLADRSRLLLCGGGGSSGVPEVSTHGGSGDPISSLYSVLQRQRKRNHRFPKRSEHPDPRQVGRRWT